MDSTAETIGIAPESSEQLAGISAEGIRTVVESAFRIGWECAAAGVDLATLPPFDVISTPSTTRADVIEWRVSCKTVPVLTVRTRAKP